MAQIDPEIERAQNMLLILARFCKLNHEVGDQLYKKQHYPHSNSLRKTTDKDKGEALEKVYRTASGMYEHGRLSDEKVVRDCLKEIMVEALYGLGTEY